MNYSISLYADAYTHSCICPREFKVHDREWPFLIDQRGARQMIIGSIVPLVTRKMQRKEKSTLQQFILVEREEQRPSCG